VFSVCTLPVRFVRSAYQRFSLLLSFSSSCFLVFLVLTILPALTLSLPFCTLSHHPGLLTSACPDPEPVVLYLVTPLWIIDLCLP
jgi:hypothetical protein